MVRALRLYFRNLLNFHPPVLESLVCANLFINEKPYLYIYWRLENGFKIRVRRLKTIYSPESTLVFKIPGNLTKIDLVYSNTWRKRKERLFLSKISIDEKVLSSIMTDNFKPVRKPIVEGVNINVILPAVFRKRVPNYQLNISGISVKHQAPALKHHEYE